MTFGGFNAARAATYGYSDPPGQQLSDRWSLLELLLAESDDRDCRFSVRRVKAAQGAGVR